MLVLGVFFFQIREQFDSLDLHHLESLKESTSRRSESRSSCCSAGVRSLGALVARALSAHGAGAPSSTSRSASSPSSPPARSPRASSATARSLVAHEQFFIDPFNVFLVTLTAFVGLTTVALLAPLHAHRARPRARDARRGCASTTACTSCSCSTMLLALTTNNIGLLWVAMEAATLSTVLLVTLYRTPASLEAAWKYFILCGVGIAQALFGTILLYFAAEKSPRRRGRERAAVDAPQRGQGAARARRCCRLAFVFLLVGYGTKVGLVPLHNWLPDAHAEGPTPISAVLSGLLLNVALYAVVRCKVLVDGSLHSALAARAC